MGINAGVPELRLHTVHDVHAESEIKAELENRVRVAVVGSVIEGSGDESTRERRRGKAGKR